MADAATQHVQAVLDELYRAESRRIFATLVRLLGDFDLAEEALQEAFAAAVEQWPRDGIPANPVAWLVSAGRFKAIDAQRRRARFESATPELIRRGSASSEVEDFDEGSFNDDHLRLIFTCCHPSLPKPTQVAMTLREVCGLTTDAIARAFLTSGPTIAQRIVRGKAKLREERVPYEVPGPDELPRRLQSVLAVIYLVFNEGYVASSGDSLLRADLSREAIRLARVLVGLLPDPEGVGLLALMLLHESRRAARVDTEGDVVLLDDQDRSRWNRDQIAEGQQLAARAWATREVGPYTIQAAIAAIHAASASPAETDWGEIVALYDLLIRITPSPVVELNRAVAVARRDGPEAALPLVDALLAQRELGEYHWAHAARADLCRRLGRTEESRASYEQALALAVQEPERRFLQRRLQELA